LIITSIPERVVERIRDKVAMGPKGCHISTYSVASHGYAQVGWGEAGERFLVLVHQAIWLIEHGPIPDGMTVDHECKNRRCMRLSHLRLITNLENARRTHGRDWPLGECAQGHLDADHWVPARGRTKGHCGLCLSIARAKYDLKIRRERAAA